MSQSIYRRTGFLGLTALATAAVILAVFGGAQSQAGPGDLGTRTIYNHCHVQLWNNIPHNVKLTHIEKHSHDSWVKHREPTDLHVPFNTHYGAPMIAITESGFARGCWNILRWHDSHGTIESYAFDPYSGPNRYHCKATGEYRCYHQEQPNPKPFHYENDRHSGDYLLVNYKICMVGKHCPGTHHPAPHYP